jgi:D-tyrosyl-tRNA(Tyr) deacylase
MRAVIQRVSRASVTIDGKIHCSTALGFLVLLGIEGEDKEQDVSYLCQKIGSMRIFSDVEGKMNLDLKQINGEVLVVSQFTLHASTKKGNRPSFIRAAPPAQAIPLYESFISKLSAEFPLKVKSGVFGADMKVDLLNDGPVTILLDSRSPE